MMSTDQLYKIDRYQGTEFASEDNRERLKKKRLKQLTNQAKKRESVFEQNQREKVEGHASVNEDAKLCPFSLEEIQTGKDTSEFRVKCHKRKRVLLSHDDNDSAYSKKVKPALNKNIGETISEVITVEHNMMGNTVRNIVGEEKQLQVLGIGSSPSQSLQERQKQKGSLFERIGIMAQHEGFTVIGEIQGSKKGKVKRVLPEWLANPTVIHTDLKQNNTKVENIPGVNANMINRLHGNGITHLFPVQRIVVPWLLNRNTSVLFFRPRDICVSAPTGSGKTLAFVLPIVQSLKDRTMHAIRALVVVPVRDLAIQVYRVFKLYCQDTTLNVGLVTGQKTFGQEQETLVRKGIRGYHSLVDIVVATPGRLVDHMKKTMGFSLTNLQFLVMDEADRMMDGTNQGWLTEVEKAVSNNASSCFDTGTLCNFNHHPLTACSFGQVSYSVQKLLYSATLSQDPEKLQQLSLYYPKLFTSLVKPVLSANSKMPPTHKTVCINIFEQRNAGKFIGKYTTPAELKEYYIECEQSVKPLVVWHLIHSRRFCRVLCFSSSVETTHRLYLVMKELGDIRVAEFSSTLRAVKRKKMLKQFSMGKVDILVCSDVMARGMDVENVDCVICYDAPTLIKTYIHRVGRTARAGREGAAVTLLQNNQVGQFQGMMKLAGKKSISELQLSSEELEQFGKKYQQALERVHHVVAQEHMYLRAKKNPVQKKLIQHKRCKH